MTSSNPASPGRRGRPETALDPATGPVAEFAEVLRELRAGAGNPPYKAMQRRAGLSASALSEAARGSRLPTWRVAEAYIRACGADPLAFQDRWRAAHAAARVPDQEDDAPDATAREEPGHGVIRRTISRRLPAALRPVHVLVTAAVCASVTAYALATHSGSPPGQHGTARTAQAPAVSLPPVGSSEILVGYGCPQPFSGALDFDHRDWQPQPTGGWSRGGCTGSVLVSALMPGHRLPSPLWWILQPGGADRECGVSIYVPATSAAAGSARYRLFAPEPSGAPSELGTKVISQADHHGEWIDAGTYRLPMGVLKVELTVPATDAMPAQVAAAPVNASCL